MTDRSKDFEYDPLVDEYQFETLAVRGGQTRSLEGEHAEPIYTTSSYVFASAQEAADRFSGDVPGNVYSRYTNPTVRMFEERMAALEAGEACAATSSGMSAIYATCLAFLSQGDHLLASRSIFGSTNVLFEKYLKKFGIEVSYVDLTDLEDWQNAIQSNTKIMFLESPSNPMCDVADISALANLASEHEILLVVDNCFSTPALQQPLKLGADLVIHSATKFIDGQGRCLGGAVVGDQELVDEVIGVLRSMGPTMSPFNAWVFLKGLETLKIRMEAHSKSALDLAIWLTQHPKVNKVNYVGLEDHPSHQLASQQMSGGYGGVLSFDVKGGREGAWKVIDGTRILSITANLGDTKTTITHPATTTHSRMAEEDRERAGITEGLVRICVGLESVEDIKADLSAGLDQL